MRKYTARREGSRACPDCGALVSDRKADQEVHDRWHLSLVRECSLCGEFVRGTHFCSGILP